MNWRIQHVLGAFCAPALIFTCYAAPVHSPGKPLTAEAILDRYVEVTGGADLYDRYRSYTMYTTVTRADGTTYNTAVFHSRDGSTKTEIDAGSESSENGVGNGIVWEYSEKTGAKILSGKVAARRLAEAAGLGAGDWRSRFHSVRLAGTQVVNGKSCYRVKLTQADGSIVDRFYDIATGLLLREVTTDFNDTGEQPLITDFEQYESSVVGPTHATLLRVKAGSIAYTVHIDSLTYSTGLSQQARIAPREVVRAAAEHRNTGLPNAVDLVDRFIQATGGKDAYQSIRLEAIKAELSFAGQNVSFPVVMYAASRKSYVSMDIPSLGKFEFGTDGATSWQRSVALGPRLVPFSPFGGLVGPSATDVMRWTDADLALETTGKDEVNGSPCYTIKMGSLPDGAPSESACFDVQTGLLTRSTGIELNGSNLVPVDMVFSDYRSDGRFTTAHHIETNLAGQRVVLQIKEITINGPLPRRYL